MRLKITIILSSILLIVIFSLQNAEIVQLKFLFWEITCPRILLILISVSLGVVIGMFIPRRRKQKTDTKEDNKKGEGVDGENYEN